MELFYRNVPSPRVLAPQAVVLPRKVCGVLLGGPKAGRFLCHVSGRRLGRVAVARAGWSGLLGPSRVSIGPRPAAPSQPPAPGLLPGHERGSFPGLVPGAGLKPAAPRACAGAHSSFSGSFLGAGGAPWVSTGTFAGAGLPSTPSWPRHPGAARSEDAQVEALLTSRRRVSGCGACRTAPFPQRHPQRRRRDVRPNSLPRGPR